MPKNRIPAKYRKTNLAPNAYSSEIKIYTDRNNPLDRKNIAITFPDWTIKQLDSYGSRHRSVVVRKAIAWFESTKGNYKDYKDPKLHGFSCRISLSLPPDLVDSLDKLGRGERSYYLRVAVSEYLKSKST